MNFKICASILLVIGGVSYCSGKVDYEHITDSKECDDIAPFHEWQDMAKGTNPKSEELSYFPIFDTSMRNENGSCYVFKTVTEESNKTVTERYRLPGYIHHVTKLWEQRSDKTKLLRTTSSKQIRVDKNSYTIKAYGSYRLKFYAKLGYERREKLLSHASEISARYVSNLTWKLKRFIVTLHSLSDVRLDTKFVESVKKLPVTFDDEKDGRYKELVRFVANYGHMFPKEIALGGFHSEDFYFGNCTMTSLQLEQTVDEIKSLVEVAYVPGAGADVTFANERIQYLKKTTQMSRQACMLKGGTGSTCPLNNLEIEKEFANSISKHPALIEGDYQPIYTILDHPDFVNLPHRSDIQKALRRFIENDLKSKEAPLFFRCFNKNRECRCEFSNVSSNDTSDDCCSQLISAAAIIYTSTTDCWYLSFLCLILMWVY